MQIFILSIIAIGILLLSEGGKILLGSVFRAGIVFSVFIGLFAIVALLLDIYTVEEILTVIGLFVIIPSSFYFFNRIEQNYKSRHKK